jgi:hypothetical protein
MEQAKRENGNGFKKRSGNVYLLLILSFSIILVLVSVILESDISDNDSKTFFLLKTVLMNIGVTGIATIIISWLTNKYMINSSDFLIGQVNNQIEKISKFSAIGLKDIFLRKEGNDLSTLIQNSRNIDCMYNTGSTFLKVYYSDLQRAISKGCRIRFLISSPNSPILTDKTKRMEHLKSALCECPSILSEIKSSKRLIGEITRDPEVLRYMRCFPTGSVILFDGRICIYTPYIPYSDSARSFIMIYENNNSEIFSVFQNMFEKAWEDSEPSA